MKSSAVSRLWPGVFLGSSAALAVGAWAAFGCGDPEGSTFEEAPRRPPPAPPTGPLLPEASPEGPAMDFPKDPIIDGDAPPDSPGLFAGAQVAPSGGPCLMEPEVGSMLPKNWLRPRFRWIATNALAGDGGAADAGAGAQNLFELRLHADNQVNDLVVYTSSPKWTMPKEMWSALRLHSAGVPMTMTVRGGVLEAGVLKDVSAGSTGPLSIAPVDAPGTIVYWTTTAGGPNPGGYNPVLKGFRIGDESVNDVLRPAQMDPTDAGPVRCLGCHTSTPDGLYAAASIRPVASGGGLTQIDFGSVDGSAAAPPYVTDVAQRLLHRSEQMAPTFSPAHFGPGDRIAVSMYKTSPGFDVIWTNLETSSTAQGTGWGIFARTGDTNHAALANVSHDGTKIVYVSTPNQDTAGTIVTQGKLFTVPWNNRLGGTAAEVAGANADGAKQFYPAYSPDDSLIAFDRSTAGTSSYNDPGAELYVIPGSGGTAERLAANDPPACSGAKSPGVYNSWPKWSPEVLEAGGKKYYFVVFSSARNNGSQRFGARLYITPVVVEGGTITTYSALYLWNQPESEDNHSPAWDAFKIPEVVPK